MDRQILPVCSYNPRDTADPLNIVFRIEDTVEEYNVYLDRDALSDAFECRIAVKRFSARSKRMTDVSLSVSRIVNA